MGGTKCLGKFLQEVQGLGKCYSKYVSTSEVKSPPPPPPPKKKKKKKDENKTLKLDWIL